MKAVLAFYPPAGGRRLHDAGLWPRSSGQHENWFDRIVSADAAGIILTSLAVNRRLAANHDSGNPALTHLYMLRDAQLWNHITLHPNATLFTPRWTD
jgi:hypothetical protein